MKLLKIHILLLIACCSLMVGRVNAQVSCDLSNYSTTYVLNANDYPYTFGNGITVTSTAVGIPTLANFSYACGGNTFNTNAPAYWLNAATQQWILTFSSVVTNFTLICNGIEVTEAFTVTPSSGTVTFSNFCAAGFTATGNVITCNGPGVMGTIFTINNPAGATQYTITHNGLMAGARVGLMDCVIGGCVARDTIRPVICDNQAFYINSKEYKTSGTYIDTFKIGSCDSIVTTVLTVNPTYEQTIVDSFYEGGTYHYNGQEYTSAGTYKLNYPSVQGCDSVTYLALKEIPFRVYNVDTIMCQGYFFTFQGKKYDRTGIYSDTFVAPGYHKVLNLDLTIRPNPNLKMTIKDKDPNELCAGEPITLMASGAESYEWLRRRSPVDERLYTEAEFKTFVYGPETPMALIGRDDIGCYTRIEFDLLGKNCCDLVVPTAFSPNGDGLNDGFSVLGRQPARYTINIYNRLGNLVFTAERVDAVWDGSFKGREAPQDTYFYIIQGECFDGSVINKKGDITLVR